MANAHSSIFRNHAVQQYMQRQEKMVSPHLVEPPLFAFCGILFGVFLLVSCFVRCEEVPIYITGSGIITPGQNEHVVPGKGWTLALVFMPVSFHPMVHAGLPICLQTGTGSSCFSGRIEKVEAGIVNPLSPCLSVLTLYFRPISPQARQYVLNSTSDHRGFSLF